MQRKRRKLMFDRAVLPGQSLRRQERKLFARLRKGLLAKANGRCTACRSKSPKVSELEAHEVYSYPGKGIVRLKKIALLCRPCHRAVHLDRSMWIASLYVPIRKAEEAKQAERKRLLTHYCKVNGVTRRQAERDWEQAKPPYDLKELDFGPYKAEVARAANRRYRWQGWISLPQGDRGSFLSFCEQFDKLEDEVFDEFGVDIDQEQHLPHWQEWISLPQEKRGSFRTFCEDALNDEFADEFYEFLPDHEYPEDTAMWRDTFRA
jgi:hypothetical protein